MNKLQLLQKIESANSPDFGNILSKSFDLFKKVWMDGFLHLLVTALAAIPLMLVIYLPLIPAFIAAAQSEGGPENFQPNLDYPILTIVGYVIMVFVVMILTQVLSIGITAHYFKVCKIKDLDSQEDDGGYFSYLKGVNFGKLFVLSMATFGIAIIAALLCYLPIFYVMVPLQLIVVIFAFNNNLSVSEIISISFKLGNKFWLLVFGLIIVSSMIAQLGVILCFVGLFFTAYFTHIPIYYFYKETIGFGGDSDDLKSEFSTEYLN
jgi:hypothetical protein